MTWEVRHYVSKRGESPVQKFIESLDDRSQQKVLDSIAILRDSGPFLKPPYMKKLNANLYELRIKSAVAVRVCYSPITGIYYLLHAFVKKTQKTPDKDLHVAIDRMNELL
jgi:phage-related protein